MEAHRPDGRRDHGAFGSRRGTGDDVSDCGVTGIGPYQYPRFLVPLIPN